MEAIPEEDKQEAVKFLKEMVLWGRALVETVAEQPAVQDLMSKLKGEADLTVAASQRLLSEKVSEKLSPAQQERLAAAVEQVLDAQAQVQDYLAQEKTQEQIEIAV